MFVQQLMGNFLQYKKEGLEKFKLDADLLEFIKGRKLQRGRPWKKCKAPYMPLNVKGCHWMVLFIDIMKCKVTVFDSDVAATRKEEWANMLGHYVLCCRLYYA